ncbi:MAG: tetratricopeptide repeat protein, partial [Planctomycetes bacterium]|nr:tetratricopeptide repeat protein [Planctomycetota bacterium]
VVSLVLLLFFGQFIAADESDELMNLYYQTGLTHYKKGNYASAAEKFQKALSYQSTFLPALFKSGEAAEKLNDHKAALKYYRLSLKELEARDKLTNEEKDILKQTTAALDRLDLKRKKVVTITNKAITRLKNLGRDYNKKKHRGLARQCFKTVLLLDPDEPTALKFMLKSASSGKASSQPEISRKGLLAYWSFDKDKKKMVIDLSGHGNNGTLTNGAAITRKGKSGRACSFDGQNDHIKFANILNTLPDSNFTLAAWIKPRIVKGHMMIIAKGRSDDYAGTYSLAIYSNKIRASIRYPHRKPYYTYALGKTVLSPKKWYYVVSVFNKGNNISVYVNGVLDGSVKWNGEWVTGLYHDLSVGAIERSGYMSNYFKGLIDEVRIYNRALSSKEIKAYYKKVK